MTSGPARQRRAHATVIAEVAAANEQRPTPFSGTHAAPPSAADEVAAEGADLTGATGFVDALTPAELGELPFGRAASGVPATPSVEETAFLPALDPAQVEALPFDAEASAHAPPRAADQVAAEGADMVGETAFVPAVEVDAQPAQAGAPSPLSSFTLEQAVALVVELDRAGDDRDGVLRRYGVTSEAAERLRAYWMGRIATDGAVRAAWIRAGRTYERWLDEKET
jgi:hypothetical protein